MTRVEHLLTIASEECAEVAQRISKALRFGLNEIQPGQSLTNAERIALEYADLQAVMEMLDDAGLIDTCVHPKLRRAKQHKVEEFLKYSKLQGTLETL